MQVVSDLEVVAHLLVSQETYTGPGNEWSLIKLGVFGNKTTHQSHQEGLNTNIATFNEIKKKKNYVW